MKLYSFGLVVFVLVFSLALVSAENNGSNNVTAKCEALNSRIEQKIADFDSGKVRRMNSYYNALNRTNEAMMRLSDRGVNVSSVEDDLIVLSDYINQFNADYELFIVRLQAAKNYTCGQSQGDFLNALNESKAQIKLLKADDEAIKRQMEVIRNDLQSAKDSSREGKIDELRQRFQDRKMEFKNESERLRLRLNETLGNVQEKRQNLEERRIELKNRIADLKGKAQEVMGRVEARAGGRQ